MPPLLRNRFYQVSVLLICSLLLAACSSKNEVQQIQQLLQLSDSVLWQSKSQAKLYAQYAYDKSVGIKNDSLQSKSLQKLANAGRGNITIQALYQYDSTALAYARKSRDEATILKSLLAYAKDLIATNKTAQGDTLLQEAEPIDNRLKDDLYHASYLQILGALNSKKFKPSSAKENFEASLHLAEKMGNGFLAALNRLNISQANTYLGAYDSTGKEIYKALEYFKKNHYPEAEANAWFSIGENYRYLGNIAKAQQYYFIANELLAHQENYLMAGMFQNAIFLTMLSAGKLPEAKEAVAEMERYFSIIEYGVGLGLAQNYWGQYYTASNQFKLARRAFRQADSIAIANDFSTLQVMNTMHKAALLDKQKMAKEADSAALLALQSVQHMVSPKLIESIYTTKDGKQYSDAEKKLYLDSTYLQDSGMAYFDGLRSQYDSENHPIYQPLLSAFDSSTAISFSRQSDEIEAQYKTRIISDSLQLQKQQTDLNESKLKTRNITLIATATLLLLVAIGGYLQYRSRQRAERDKARIELLQNEIHHRVKNNLAVVNRLVDVAGKNSVEDAPLSALKNRIKSIELLHNHLYSREAAAGNIALQPYLNDLCLAIAATFHTAKNISIQVNAPAEVDSAIAEKLGLIVNELVTNSYKYAFENRETGTVNITAQQEAGTLTVQVADDGIGLPETKAGSSYGMKLIKGLSHELKGRFAFHNSNGTRFEIAIPVTA